MTDTAMSIWIEFFIKSVELFFEICVGISFLNKVGIFDNTILSECIDIILLDAFKSVRFPCFLFGKILGILFFFGKLAIGTIVKASRLIEGGLWYIDKMAYCNID